jgi:hypothetical protein
MMYGVFSFASDCPTTNTISPATSDCPSIELVVVLSTTLDVAIALTTKTSSAVAAPPL